VAEKNKVPLVEGLFTWPSDKPKLIGSHCKKCGSYAFPKQAYCGNPDCEKDTKNVEVVELSNRGKLYTWAVQVQSPPLPFKMDPFEPIPMGMIDLPEGLRVLGMMTTVDNVTFGTEVEMTAKKLFEDDNNEYLTWCFAPVVGKK
jgi:uncharacterized OB-fold protein